MPNFTQIPGWPLVLALGPLLVMAIAMHLSARWVQGASARLLGPNAFSILTAPGVVVHELGHALFCFPFGHSIQQIRLFQLGKDGTLGFVKHSYNPRNPYAILGNFFIGTGPIWLGGLCVLALAHYLFPWALQTPLRMPDLQLFAADPRNWLGLYLMVAIGAHVRLSLPDLQGSWGGGLLALLLLGLGTWAYLRWGAQVKSLLPIIAMAKEGLRMMTWALIPALAVNLLVALGLSGIARILGR